MARQSRSATTEVTVTDEVAVPVTAGRCSNGCSGNLVTITMFVRSEAVTMTSCSTCDKRSWSRAGEPVELRSLLDDIKASQPQRANPAPVLRRAG